MTKNVAWASNSPDLPRIETLWHEINNNNKKKQLRTTTLRNIAELKDKILHNNKQKQRIAVASIGPIHVRQKGIGPINSRHSLNTYC